jgi:hypothetical protein
MVSLGNVKIAYYNDNPARPRAGKCSLFAATKIIKRLSVTISFVKQYSRVLITEARNRLAVPVPLFIRTMQ